MTADLNEIMKKQRYYRYITMDNFESVYYIQFKVVFLDDVYRSVGSNDYGRYLFLKDRRGIIVRTIIPSGGFYLFETYKDIAILCKITKKLNKSEHNYDYAALVFSSQVWLVNEQRFKSYYY